MINWPLQPEGEKIIKGDAIPRDNQKSEALLAGFGFLKGYLSFMSPKGIKQTNKQP